MHFITASLLLAKARRGNQQAFAKLYDAYVDQIYRFILFKAPSVEQAQDLTAESFLKTWKYIQQGADIANFKAFVYKVARNLLIDTYRHREKAERMMLPLESADQIKDFTQETQILTKYDVVELSKALLTLKEEWREAILLRYVEGLDINEMAEILERNEGAVRVLIHRAQKALKEIYKENHG